MAEELGRIFRIGHGLFEFSRRLDAWNHVPYFAACFTGVFDSTPYEISEPTKADVHFRTRCGKDKINAFIAMTGWSFLGLPTCEYGLCLPKNYDAHIMRWLDARYVPYLDEMRIGDGHFSTALNFVAPPRKRPGYNFTLGELLWKRMIQLVRAPVEQGQRQMKLPKMFQVRFRGTYSNMQMWYKIASHVRARDMYMQSDAGWPFHRGFGPFRHF
jgi:hypothetical protein